MIPIVGPELLRVETDAGPRLLYDWLAENEPTLNASVTKHRKEWRALLGLPQ